MRLASRTALDRMTLMALRVQRVWNPAIHLPLLALFAYAAWLVLASPSRAQELLGALGVVAASRCGGLCPAGGISTPTGAADLELFRDWRGPLGHCERDRSWITPHERAAA